MPLITNFSQLRRYLLPSLHQKVPLHLAAGEGHLDIVRYLVEDKGADKSVKDTHGVSNDTTKCRVLCFNISLILMLLTKGFMSMF